jgi:hypothetical protein
MRFASVALLALLLAGCAGGYVLRPQSDNLRLGTTRYDQVVEVHGSPHRTSTQTVNGVMLIAAVYSHANTAPFTPRVWSRSTIFYFQEDVLVGYVYSSSFGDDSTDFDETLAARIKQGQTTRAQVVELLGRPGGAYIHPLIKGREDNAVVYAYSGATRVPLVPGSVRIARKQLVISIGPDNVVTDVIYRELKPQ